MAGRRALAGAATLMLAVPLAGCQAGTMGAIGITRTNDGALAAVVARCTETVARIEVGHGPKSENARRTVDLTLEAFRPSKDDLVVVPLSVEAAGWHRSPTVFAPTETELYSVVATDRARGWTTGEALFTAAELPADLAPDTVLVTFYVAEDGADVPKTEVVSLSQFRTDACE
jgi:hypothetical protein